MLQKTVELGKVSGKSVEFIFEDYEHLAFFDGKDGENSNTFTITVTEVIPAAPAKAQGA
jgi:hypothetical protein